MKILVTLESGSGFPKMHLSRIVQASELPEVLKGFADKLIFNRFDSSSKDARCGTYTLSINETDTVTEE